MPTIRELRLRRRMTQEDLARRAGVSQSLLSRIERGERRPRVETAEKIAGSLNTTLDGLDVEVSREP